MSEPILLAAIFAAVDARIITERADGSGIVEVPILRVGSADWSDQGGGSGTFDVTADVLRSIVANFQRGRGLIVGVGPSPHRTFDQRGGPQDAFVDSLRIDGAVLYAVHDIADPELFAQVKARKWRGYSVELLHSQAMPTVLQSQYHFDGWVLVGGIFTNRPAFDTVFKIAAETIAASAVFAPMRASEESGMPEDKTVSLALHEGKVSELTAAVNVANDRVSRLETQNAGLQAEIVTLRKSNDDLAAVKISAENEKTVAVATSNRLEAQNKQLQGTIRSLETSKTELEIQVREQDKVASDTRIKALVASVTDPKDPKAIRPARFDYITSSASPTDAVLSRYTSVDMFEAEIKLDHATGTKVPASSPVNSGHDPAKEAESNTPDKQLTAEEQRVFNAMNLGTEFVGITTEAEARAAYKARKDAQAAAK